MVRLASFIMMIILAAGFPAAGGAAAVDPPSGRSATLGIGFQVEGGVQWCSSGIDVTLTSGKSARLVKNSEKFQQMLGRIRAIVVDQCPTVRLITYTGKVKNKAVSIGESSEMTDWVYVPLELQGSRPACKGRQDAKLCAARWETFLALRKMARIAVFDQMKLASYLTIDRRADVEFVSHGVVGRINSKKTDTVPYDNSEDFVLARTEHQLGLCSGRAEATGLERLENGASYQSVICSSSRGRAQYHLLVAPTEHGFLAIAFADFSASGVAGTDLARLFTNAVKTATRE